MGARGSPPTNVRNFPFSIFDFTFAITPAGLVVIQCKFYSQPVGYSSVQEAYTARALYSARALERGFAVACGNLPSASLRRISLSIVCSNARFTRQARTALAPASRLGFASADIHRRPPRRSPRAPLRTRRNAVEPRGGLDSDAADRANRRANLDLTAPDSRRSPPRAPLKSRYLRLFIAPNFGKLFSDGRFSSKIPLTLVRANMI